MEVLMEQENNNVEVVEETKVAAEPEQKEPQDEKKYSDSDVDAIVKKKYAKWQKEQDAKVDEAKKLAKMNADEKAKYEREQRDKELAEREAAITKRELTATAKETLADKGLPIELSAVLDYSNAEACNESILAVEKAFMSAVNKAVEQRLKGSAPIEKAPENQGISTQEFRKMTIAQRTELKQTNPELYEQRKGR